MTRSFILLKFCRILLVSFVMAFAPIANGQLKTNIPSEQFELDKTFNGVREKLAEEQIYESLFEANMLQWNEDLFKNVNLLETKWREEFQVNNRKLLEEQNAAQLREEGFLEQAMRLSRTSTSSLEAQFFLGIRLLKATASAKRGQQLLENFLSSTSSRQEVLIASLRAHAALQLGIFFMAQAKYNDAERWLQTALQIVSRQKKADSVTTMGIHEYHALLALGDAFFYRYLYNRAEQYYTRALNLAISAPLSVASQAFERLPELYVRLVWSAFKGGRLPSAINYASQYAKKRASWKSLPSVKVEGELVRVAAISYFETPGAGPSQALALDPLAGEFGKKILLASLEEFLNAGRFRAGIERAESVLVYFEKSASALHFFEKYALLHEKEGNLRAKFVHLKRLVDLGSVSSFWSKRFAFGKENVNKERKKFILQYALQVANYFDEEFEKTSNKLSAAWCFDAYKARLEEFEENENRNALMVYAARSALRAGFLQEAVLLAEDSFRFDALNKQSLLDNPTRIGNTDFLISGTEKKQLQILAYETLIRALQLTQADQFARHSHLPLQADPLLEKYRLAVDAFVREFPELALAREFLFESAWRMERYQLPEEAIERYQRTLLVTPKDAIDELNALLPALVKVHLRFSSAENAMQALGGLETVAETVQISESSRLSVYLASEAALRLLAAERRRAGKHFDAAMLMINWVKGHKSNPEAAIVMRDALVLLMELGDVRKAKATAQWFLDNYADHPYGWEVLQLAGQANEMFLSFRLAAIDYVRSSLEDRSLLPTWQRLRNLQRASLFFAELGELEEAATLQAKVSLMYLKQGEVVLAAQGIEKSADRYFKAEDYARASLFYAQAAGFLGRPQNRSEAFQKQGDLLLKAKASRARVLSLAEKDLQEAYALLSRFEPGVVPEQRSLAFVAPKAAINSWDSSLPAQPSRLFWAIEITKWENAALENLVAQEADTRGLLASKVMSEVDRALRRMDSLSEKEDPDILLQRAIAYEKFADLVRRLDKESLQASEKSAMAKSLFFKTYLNAQNGSSVKEAAAAYLKRYTMLSAESKIPLVPEVPR